MANNRLFLCCTRCHEDSQITIARLQVGMDEQWLPARTPIAEYEAWLLKHSDCGEGGGLQVGLDSENTLALTIDRTST